MTPLHKTAQEAIEMIATEDLSKWASRHDKVVTGALKSAIHAEQAQAVEPKPRDHVRDAGKMINERDELIDRLSFTAAESAALRPMCIAAIEMLEADAQEIAGWKADQKENLSNQVALQGQINGLKAQQVAVPTGWALVPIEPTPAILDAMSSSGWKTACYKAMLAAAQGVKLVTKKDSKTDWSAA